MYSFTEQYIVKPGDTLSKLVRDKELVSCRQLLHLNPDITNPDSIFPGQVINIPKMIPMTTYLIKPGDTISSIIWSYNIELMRYYGIKITLEEVLAYNPKIVNPDLIFSGEILYLPEIL